MIDWEKASGEVGKKIGNWFDRSNSGVLKTAGVAGAAIASVGVMSAMVSMSRKAESNDMKAQQRRNTNKEIKKRNDDKLLREAYNYRVRYKYKEEDMVLPNYNGLNQELFMRRTNHTNTWGGRRY